MRLRLDRKSSAALVANYWWSVIVAGIAVVAVGVLLNYKLATLLPGFSSEELAQRAESARLLTGNNPLFFIQNGLQYIAQQLNHYGPVAMRLPGTLIGGLVVLCFFKILNHWYTTRIALLGALILTTSSWFLHTTRLATHDVAYLLLFVFFVLGAWMQHVTTSRYALVASLIVASAVLYIPGMLWFIFPALIWQRRRLRNVVATLAKWQIACIILVILGIAVPGIWAGIHNSDFVLNWLGLPASWPSIRELLANLGQIPVQLFWRGPENPTYWLGSLPLLDWFQAVMFVIGIYSYRFKLGLDRTLLLAYVCMVGSILIALRGPVSMALLLPFVFLVVIGGIAFMLQQWYTVFPRNPFARITGFVVLSAALLISCTFQLSHYFVAWPKAPATKAVFIHRP